MTTYLSFKDLKVTGSSTSTAYPTMGDVLNVPGWFKQEKVTPKVILNQMNGVVQLGEMVLVLGKPGSGCTSLLKVLSCTDLNSFKSIEGDIIFNNSPIIQNSSQLVYSPELEFHYPHLTVNQTLDFATKSNRKNIEDAEQVKMDIVRKLGIEHTLGTKVGNDFVRGISGGERKRVSIAEVLACNGIVNFWDNSTRGLDSSTALEFIENLHESRSNKINIVSIYQASERIYELFDKVTVLYEGKQIFYGRTEVAKKYFQDMGFHCPERQTTPEFLTSVTDGSSHVTLGWESKVPRTSEEFVEKWMKSDVYLQLQEELNSIKDIQPITIPKRHMVSFPQQLTLNTIRHFQNMLGDKTYFVSQTCASLFQGLVVGSVFYNIPENTDGLFSRRGAVFGATLFVVLMSMNEVSGFFAQRPILAKQRNLKLFRLSSEGLSYQIAKLPTSLLSSLVLSIPIFFLADLRRTAANYFTLLLFAVLLSMTYSAWFQLVASSIAQLPAAMAAGGFSFFICLIYSSFFIQRITMHPWFKWFSYINPMFYGFESMISSEYLQDFPCSNDSLIPNYSLNGYQGLSSDFQSGGEVCAAVGALPGQTTISGSAYIDFTYNYRYSHVWRNLGFLIAFTVLFNCLNCIVVEYTNPVTIMGDKLLYLSKHRRKYKAADEESQQQEESYENTIEGERSDKSDGFQELESKDLFAWKDVSYTINVKGEERKLLDNITGFCKPGTLTALMGASGAGKTTLLNVLAQRTNMGIITGDMLVNGSPLDASFGQRTGYVQQQDIHLTQLTVRESLVFAAKLRTSATETEKIEYVDKIIDILGMTTYKNAIVGAVGYGLNVEQRKKLSVGVELVSKPSLLLFLDEPTSGLDSQNSWAIVKLIKDLSKAGQSILCTIHQPSATLFQEFDNLLLLKKGQTVYFGPLGEDSRKVLDYFELNGGRRCAPTENPAEYALEVVGNGQEWGDIWTQSRNKHAADQELNELVEKHSTRTSVPIVYRTYPTSLTYQFRVVFKRLLSAYWRDVDYIMGKFFLHFAAGLLIGFTYFNLKKSLVGIQDGIFCAFLITIIDIPSMSQIQQYAHDYRDLYESREKLSRTYHWSIMIICQFLVEIIFIFVFASIFIICSYFPLRVTASEQAGMIYITIAVFSNIFHVSFGLLFSFLAHDVQTAGVITSLLVAIMFQTSGVVQLHSLTPGIYRFVIKLNPFTYFIQNLSIAILHNREVKCLPQELAVFNPGSGQTCSTYMAPYIQQYGGYLTNPDATSDCGYCAYTISDQFVARNNIHWSYRWRNLGFFSAYAIFNLAALLTFYFILREKQYVKLLIERFSKSKK